MNPKLSNLKLEALLSVYMPAVNNRPQTGIIDTPNGNFSMASISEPVRIQRDSLSTLITSILSLKKIVYSFPL